MKPVLWVALGGGLGSALRYLVSNMVAKSADGAVGSGTIAVNVTGALVLGFLARFLAPPHGSPTLYLALTVGVCGGYTTFSAFSLDMFTMIERGQAGRAILYALASVTLAYGALAVGYFAARALRPLP
jgi:CrcB protein